MINPGDFWMFGIIAEPISVLITGLLAKTKWKPVLAIYVIMLTAYFVHPFGRDLPLWTILDVLFALVLIYPAAKLGKYLLESDLKRLSIALILIPFVCIATDSLVRIFLFVPCGLYNLYSLSFEALYVIFVEGAVASYIEDLIMVIVSFVVGVPLLLSVLKLKLLEKKS